MANGSFTFDVSAGREVELYNRVLDSDPTNAVFTLMVLAAGHPADETLRSAATFAAILLEAEEVTNTGYARITLSDADLSALVVDSTNHTTTIPFPTQSWTGVSAGDTWSCLLYTSPSPRDS